MTAPSSTRADPFPPLSQLEQADLCQTLADPARPEMLSLLGDGPKVVKDLVAPLGQRHAKVSQRGIVHAERIG